MRIMGERDTLCHRYLTSAMGCTGAARLNFKCGMVLFQKSDKNVTFKLSKEMNSGLSKNFIAFSIKKSQFFKFS